jgi:hypothetical protein
VADDDPVAVGVELVELAAVVDDDEEPEAEDEEEELEPPQADRASAPARRTSRVQAGLRMGEFTFDRLICRRAGRSCLYDAGSLGFLP